MDNICAFSREQTVRCEYIDNYVYTYELKGGYSTGKEMPGEAEDHLMVIILEGSLTLEYGNTAQSFPANSIVNISIRPDLNRISYSSDFHGVAIAANKAMIMDIFRNRNPFPLYFIVRIKTLSHSPLSEAETESLMHDYDNLSGILGRKDHHYLKEMAYAYFYILLTDIADIIWKRHGYGQLDHAPQLSRPQSLVRSFIELVTENIENESGIGFYADKLCISKQYLSLLVREHFRMSAGELLAQTRYERAAQLLLDPRMSIQQVANRLSFRDQSHFGKFFRKYSGLSPLKYRKSLVRNLLTFR